MSEDRLHRILITGAAGKIGKTLRAGLRGHYPVIRLSDIAPLGQAAPGEEVCPVDIRDLAAVERSMTDIDCVAETFAAEVLAQNKKENEISALFHGAHYCPMEFNGDVNEVD